MSIVLYSRGNRIARVTLNRPDVLNAVNGDGPAALFDAVAKTKDGERTNRSHPSARLGCPTTAM